MVGWLPEGPRPCVTLPETVISRDGGWVPVLYDKRVDFQKVARQTWYGMTVKGLDFMFRARHILYELSDPICALEGFTIPGQGRGGSIELGEVGEPRV
jgi:hypothetical protein